jgi:hypothetical protein
LSSPAGAQRDESSQPAPEFRSGAGFLITECCSPWSQAAHLFPVVTVEQRFFPPLKDSAQCSRLQKASFGQTPARPGDTSLENDLRASSLLKSTSRLFRFISSGSTSWQADPRRSEDQAGLLASISASVRRNPAGLWDAPPCGLNLRVDRAPLRGVHPPSNSGDGATAIRPVFCSASSKPTNLQSGG